MKLGRFFWKVFLGNAALLALVMVAGVWVAIRELDRFHSEELTPYLRGQAAMMRMSWERALRESGGEPLDVLAKELAAPNADDVRVTVIAPDGRVVADSHEDREAIDSHADRPEVVEALASGEGQSTRHSHAIGTTMKYFAVRLGSEDSPVGILRLAVPIRSMAGRAAFVRTLAWPVGVIAVAAALSLAVGLAVLWSGRVRRLTRTAQTIARGDLSARIDDAGRDEVAVLARSVDRMRNRLSVQLQTIDRQREILQTLLGRLKEGVIVAGADGRIVLVNAEASRLLNLPELQWLDSPQRPRLTIEEYVPQHDLQQLLLSPSVEGMRSGGRQPLFSAEPSEARLELHGPAGPMTLLARASDIALPDQRGIPELGGANGRQIQARLVVLTDVTELTKAVKMRSDFVANASHELRTPLSAIRGAVQTLLSMDLSAEAVAAGRFLHMVERHSTRLEAMVADLLELSRLESPAKKFLPAALSVQRVCDELAGRWAEALAAKRLNWGVQIEPDCRTVTANAHLLQIVLDNLVENAIKFTELDGHVGLVCRHTGSGVAITVSDDGCGIPPQDQERVFERFYQVTSSRSAPEGPEKRGTGLGLSIVRHAVAAMEGTVRLESTLNVGTQVTVAIPDAPAAAVS